MDNELRDDVISAAIDGERVDMDALRQALRNEDGRETLAAFVLLRAATAADELVAPRRAAEFTGATGHSRLWWYAASRLRLAFAASVAVLALAASFWLGTALGGPAVTVSRLAPPTPPAMASAPPTIVSPTGIGPGDAPRPTAANAVSLPAVRTLWEPPKPARLLSFVPGVDWTSTPE